MLVNQHQLTNDDHFRGRSNQSTYSTSLKKPPARAVQRSTKNRNKSAESDLSRIAAPTEPGRAPKSLPSALVPSLFTATVQIPLTQGQFALADAQDVPLLVPYHWTALRSGNTWYAKAHRGGKTIYMHRRILFGDGTKGKRLKADHINGDGLDNRRSNLRAVTHAQNMMNGVGRPGIRKSGYKGVSVRAHHAKPFRVCIQVGGKQKHLGYFSSDIEAAKAYDRAALLCFGPHARINFPNQLNAGDTQERRAA
jgi:hypothetical protein